MYYRLEKTYYKELDEMLIKCSVDELLKFIEEWKMMYAPGFVEEFKSSADLVKEITLHKMIVNRVKLPNELREQSKNWLLSRGYDLEF